MRSQDLFVLEGERVLDLEGKREKFSSVSSQNEQHEKRTGLEAGTGMVCWSTVKEKIMAGLKYCTRKRRKCPFSSIHLYAPCKSGLFKNRISLPRSQNLI